MSSSDFSSPPPNKMDPDPARQRSVPAYRSMELSIKFEMVKSGRPILLCIEGFHKNITFLSLEIEFVLEYSVDPDEKSFEQYFLWVFIVCQSPCLLQIDLNKIFIILFYKTTLSFLTHQRMKKLPC